MHYRSAILAMTLLGLYACNQVEQREAIPEIWLGRWAEELRWCNDQSASEDNLTITNQSLSFMREAGNVEAFYGDEKHLLIVVKDAAGYAPQFRAYDLMISPDGDRLAVQYYDEPKTLVRCRSSR